MKKLATLFFVLAVSSAATVAVADTGELDPAGVAPQGLVVRDDGHGNRTVFKADSAEANVTNDTQAAAAVTSFVNANNQIASVVPASELDQTSSTESWYYWYGANSGYNNYYYGYYYYGYNYYYQPCYNWNYGGYNYYYYWHRW